MSDAETIKNILTEVRAWHDRAHNGGMNSTDTNFAACLAEPCANILRIAGKHLTITNVPDWIDTSG